MSDIGYKSKNQANLKIDYNSLNGYVESLSAAINTPYPEYEKIGVKIDGEYKQLNSNILQIENEFYSTVRPKQITESGEKPTLALKRRGVCYLEIRSLDLDIFHPLGISEQTGRFLEAFLLSCLLKDSPLQAENEQQINNSNQLTVANFGRKPDVELNRDGETISLQAWAMEILKAIEQICAVLDANHPDKPYQRALELQQRLVEDPDLTPSARILAKMTENNQCFGDFGVTVSAEHEAYFKAGHLEEVKMQNFQQMAAASLQQQQALEANDTLGLDEFLARYFSQHS
jgi:glutamate--cysteine ligase